MTLALVTPTGPVTRYDSGLIAVRLHDYEAAARGTLTTPTDASSVGGNVIRDEQTLAVQTTFSTSATRWGSAARSVEIPFADIDREATIFYDVWVGARLEGDAPTNAQAKTSWLAYDISASASLGWGWGIDNTFGSHPTWIARNLINHYILYPSGNLGPGFTGTNLVLKAWGITGGDAAIFLDMLYLVPMDATGAGEWDSADFITSDPAGFYLGFDLNGILYRDTDNDTSQWIGKHSIVTWNDPWVTAGGLLDFQEAKNEPTATDVFGFGQWDGTGLPPWDDVPDPQSWLALVAGGTSITPITFFTDGFNSTVTAVFAPYVVGDYIAFMELGTNSTFTGFYDAPTNTRRGWFVEAGSGIATCYIPANQVAGNAAPSPSGDGGYATTYWGNLEELTASPTVDPRNYRRTFAPHLESVIETIKVRFDTVQASSITVGLRRTPIENAVEFYLFGARLELDSGGGLELSLMAFSEDVQDVTPANAYNEFGAAVSVGSGYVANDWWWVKVEKRGYHWRARAWEDGTTEPDTWDVEGHEPLSYRNSTTSVRGWVDYPWDVDWVTSTDHDFVWYDPRSHNGGRWEPGHPAMFCTVEVTLPRMKIEADDLTVEWDPGEGSIDDMDVEVEKYDGLVSYGSVTVPHGAHRMLIDDTLANRHFNLDSNGFDVYAWKSGTRPLLTAGIGTIYERRPHIRFMPQIYRRIHG